MAAAVLTLDQATRQYGRITSLARDGAPKTEGGKMWRTSQKQKAVS
jgi:hypothetical protein